MEVETFFEKIFQRDVLVVKSNKVTRSLYERLDFGSKRIFEWIRRSELTYEQDLTVTRVNKDGIRENFHESESGAAKYDKVVKREVCQLTSKGTRVNNFLDSDNFEGERRRVSGRQRGDALPNGGAPAMSLDSFTRAWPRSAPSVLNDDECCSL